MAEEKKSLRENWRLIVISTTVTLLMLIICTIVNIIILILLNVYLILLFSIFGIAGGKWLWKKLASSNVFQKGIPIYVKIIGLLGLMIFIIIIGLGVSLFLSDNALLIRGIISQITILLVFVALYNAGYLLSIWRPVQKEKMSEVIEFKIKKRLTGMVFILMGIFVGVVFIIFFMFTKEFLSLGFQYFALGGVGFGLGWIFWEHLKETQILSGRFLNDLKLYSLVFEILIIILTILGILSNYIQEIVFDKFLLLCFILLLYLMAAYFVGLMLEVIRK